ncbi:MAG TPA: ABC transporter permease subunit [Chloroflexota bacterium]|nr:ABC transporter permease subunit [Chloroflexota bacterium]
MGVGDARPSWSKATPRPRVAGSHLREAALGLVMALPPFVVLLALIVYPAVEAALFSLGQVPTDNVAFSTGMHLIVSKTLTLEVYRQLFASSFFLDDLSITFFVTVLSVVLVLVISYILALYVRFGVGPLVAVVRSLYLIPLFVPVVIASYALITFYVDHGIVQAVLTHLGLGYAPPIYHRAGIVIGEVWTSIPFAVLLLGSGLDGLPQEMVEAAHDAGAGFFGVLWRIVIPLNVVPAMIVVTFTFIGVLGSFTVPYLIGPNAPQMLGVAMQAYFSSYQQPQPAVAMAMITFLLAAVAGGVYVWATARSGKAL